jgi:hypothetical protein
MKIEGADLMKPNKTNGETGALDSRLHLLVIDDASKHGQVPTPMAERMKQNWENGRFYIDYCVRRNYGSDQNLLEVCRQEV